MMKGTKYVHPGPQGVEHVKKYLSPKINKIL